MPLGRRNPHECAVAKSTAAFAVSASVRRNPHECAVAKVNVYYFAAEQLGRNPHECAVAKRVDGVVVKTENVATRTNALWQSAASVVPLLEQ